MAVKPVASADGSRKPDRSSSSQVDDTESCLQRPLTAGVANTGRSEEKPRCQLRVPTIFRPPIFLKLERKDVTLLQMVLKNKQDCRCWSSRQPQSRSLAYATFSIHIPKATYCARPDRYPEFDCTLLHRQLIVASAPISHQIYATAVVDITITACQREYRRSGVRMQLVPHIPSPSPSTMNDVGYAAPVP